MVKRISSILFLGLMVLNTVGYYSFLVIARGQLKSELADRLESASYDPAGDMIIKMPLAIPYGTDSDEYQSMTGQISYEGSVYSFVKQRIYKDTLYVVCLRDYRATEATNKIKEFSKSFADEGKQPTSGIKLIVSAAKYYCIGKHAMISVNLGWIQDSEFADLSDNYNSHEGEMIFHPPKSIS